MAPKKKQKGDARKLTADEDAYLVEQLDKHLSFVGDKSGRGGTRSWHCSHCYVDGAKPKQGSRSRQLAHLLGLQGEGIAGFAGITELAAAAGFDDDAPRTAGRSMPLALWTLLLPLPSPVVLV